VRERGDVRNMDLEDSPILPGLPDEAAREAGPWLP
jgi:hypothetical protein